MPGATPETFFGKMHIILHGIISIISLLYMLLISHWTDQTKVFPGFRLYSFITICAAFISAGLFAFNYGRPYMGLTERNSHTHWLSMDILSCSQYISTIKELITERECLIRGFLLHRLEPLQMHRPPGLRREPERMRWSETRHRSQLFPTEHQRPSGSGTPIEPLIYPKIR